MNSVRNFNHIFHYVFLLAAILCAMALVSLSGAPVRSIIAEQSPLVYRNALTGFACGFVISLALCKLNSWVEHFVND